MRVGVLVVFRSFLSLKKSSWTFLDCDCRVPRVLETSRDLQDPFRQEKDAIPGDLPNFGRLGFPTFYSKAVPWPRSLESEEI